MANPSVLHWLRTLVRTGQQRPDNELMTQFAFDGDEDAFTLLVQRHGPMVYGVCRRLLDQGLDAEDAFQATFLILARKARSVRKRASISCWLYGVASRVASNLRRKNERRQHHQRAQPARSVPPADPAWSEVRGLLDEELAKLPARLRVPLVLCYLDGKTHDEAARELGWSETTLRGRLERGRDRLRQRLASRGVTLPAALLASFLTERAVFALPVELARTTAGAAAAIFAGKPLTGVVSAKVLTLILMESNAMFLSKVIHTFLIISTATVLLGGAIAGTGAFLGEDSGNTPVQKKIENPAENPGADEHEYFVRGIVGKRIELSKKGDEDGLYAVLLQDATGKELPKKTNVVIAILAIGTKFERMVGNKREPTEDELQFRAKIAIEKDQVASVTEHEKLGQKILLIEPKKILILKEPDNRFGTNLAAMALKPQESDSAVRKLLIKKQNASVEEVVFLDKMIRVGRISISDDADRMIRAIDRYVEVQLELAQTHAERINIRTRAVQTLEVIEDVTNTQRMAGKLAPDRAARCTQALFEAQIQLLKEQGRQ